MTLQQLAERMHWPTRLLLARIETGRLLLDRKDCEDLIRWRDHQARKLTSTNGAK